ncbi:ABC transporter permease [Photobacterium sp. BZF1]|uniref:ABC transporter permease n=1 Tax=Photobacterium sp. BZF1 TaxID=1904457 RepID=UPI001653D459|nr:ABC transporter permease [Photobacterium sp. BZF1]MBC7002334.1 ABC transporter permease [Photobacterium sp. BZF1]
MSVVAKKLAEFTMVVLAATLLTYFLTWLSPGDPAQIYFEARGVSPSEEALQSMQIAMGLDKPFYAQYLSWLRGALTLDAGISLKTGEPVMDMVRHRMVMTFKLALSAIVLVVFFSMLFGVVGSIFRESRGEFLFRLLAFIAISIPDFWLGLMLIIAFVVNLNWFKITDPYAISSIVLPALTLALPLIGRYTRQIQAMIQEEMNKEYVVGARARGTKESTIILRHVLPSVLGGLSTLFGLSCALLLGGTVVVESIFSWPGLGRMALDAITFRDYPVLQAYVVIMVIIYMSVSMLADVIAALLDPRLSNRS